MKNTLHILLLFYVLSLNAQDAVKILFVNKKELKANTFVSKNNFDATFYIFDDVLFKASEKNKNIEIGYNNFQLGAITSANTYNPLKINLFYKDFNTAIILDNQLTEIFKIDFNTLKDYKNITHISTGHDNTLWVFNQNSQQLELFDYKTNTTRTKTLPIKNSILDLKSNYNYCWLLTETHLYTYSYRGSLIQKIKTNGHTALSESNGNIILQKENSLFYLKKNTQTIIPIKAPNLLINEFFVTNQTLYIYNNEMLYEYLIKTD